MTLFKLILAVFVASAHANDCTDKVVPANCTTPASSVETGMLNNFTKTSSDTVNAANHANMYSNGATGLTATAASCRANGSQACDQCKQKQASDSDIKQCKRDVESKAATFDQQATALNQGSKDTMDWKGLATGLAMGAMMAAMAANQQQQNQPPPPPPGTPMATGALQLNGTLICTMNDAYTYADCDNQLPGLCSTYGVPVPAGTVPAVPITGTVIATAGGGSTQPNCAAFTQRYCSPSYTPPSQYAMTRQDGSMTQVNLAGTGEGVNTSYCQNFAANSFCNDPDPVVAEQKLSCPACQRMTTVNSPSCATNPALCLGQGSGSVINTALSNPVCSGDPLYTPGSPYALANIPNAVVANSTVGGVLPTGGGGAVVALGPATVAKKGMGQARTREGISLSGGGSDSGMSATSRFQSTSADLVAAGGVIVASSSRAVTRGPASDVQPQSGPNLFVTSSQVYRDRCQAGRLNNCPHFK